MCLGVIALVRLVFEVSFPPRGVCGCLGGGDRSDGCRSRGLNECECVLS